MANPSDKRNYLAPKSLEKAQRRRAPTAKRKRTVRKRKPASRKKKTTTRRSSFFSLQNSRRKSAPAALAPLHIPNGNNDIIELDDDSSLSEVDGIIDDGDSDVQEISARKASLRRCPTQVRDPIQWGDDNDDSEEDVSDEENEFDG